MKFIVSFALIAFSYLSYSQDVTIQSGPMNGYAEMQEALVWVQLTGAADVHAIARPKADSLKGVKSNVVTTKAQDAFTAKLIFRHVKPGTTYNYTIYIAGEAQELPYPTSFTTQPDWSYKMDPPAFTMALGSCTYINEKPYDRPGDPYGGGYGIFKSISDVNPDLMLWLGDNTYLRPADWWTRTGYLNRYTHTRSLPELQPLLAQCNHFAIWDDHEFGPNDATGSWIHKDLALDVFKAFWGNLTYGYDDLPGIMSGFAYNDIQVILMDNRYNRTETYADADREHIFGKAQSDRLIDLLKQSNAPFKLVATGGQFLNTAKKYENHANYENERQYIIDRIEEEGIEGVIFISGDRHHSEVSALELENGHTIHEFTVSPLTSSANTNVDEQNDHRVEGSLIQQRNFATLEVSGAFRERVITLTYFGTEGEKLYEYKLEQPE